MTNEKDDIAFEEFLATPQPARENGDFTANVMRRIRRRQRLIRMIPAILAVAALPIGLQLIPDNAAVTTGVQMTTLSQDALLATMMSGARGLLILAIAVGSAVMLAREAS